MVRVTSQGSNRRSQQRSGSGRVGNKSGRNRNSNAGYKIQGPMEKHTPRPRLQVWPSLKYTCNQPQVMANCQSEPLVVSTCWPALVLQPTRHASPTTIGKSIIPDNG
ncbi:unnamed protein product [Staurois parvus]|uniref:Uncharacterized protein n=1 Tax=Staurois parvus TaxID=386267 RepID=A0ABN9GPN3_9NEOB|nr:unnamed protein product [Staurois parvus]